MHRLVPCQIAHTAMSSICTSWIFIKMIWIKIQFKNELQSHRLVNGQWPSLSNWFSTTHQIWCRASLWLWSSFFNWCPIGKWWNITGPASGSRAHSLIDSKLKNLKLWYKSSMCLWGSVFNWFSLTWIQLVPLEPMMCHQWPVVGDQWLMASGWWLVASGWRPVPKGHHYLIDPDLTIHWLWYRSSLCLKSSCFHRFSINNLPNLI